MSFEAAVHAKAIQLGRNCLEMCAAAGSGHPTSGLSLGHIVTVLMYHTMRWVPDDPTYPTSDRLVLSEGHAVPIVYAACADVGVAVGRDERRPLTTNDLKTLRAVDSILDGHPNPREGFPFFDAATGSLGQGLSVAAGLGLAARNDNIDKHIYCLIGDGESREGQIAEALDFIADHKLTNVVPVFNCNHYGQADKVSKQQTPEVLSKKLEAYGFTVINIDGHKPSQIREAFEQFTKNTTETPIAVVAKTIKGWGCPSLQGGGWHGKPPVGDQLDRALQELNQTGVGLTSSLTTDELRIYPPKEYQPTPVQVKTIRKFDEAMKAADMDMVLKAGKLATRRAFGLALRELGHSNPKIVALDADVSNSTFTQYFARDKELSARFYECKIAEQNMISAAAGLSAAGKIPFCTTFGKFVTRAYDQVELAIISGANIKVVGSHVGITPCSDGPSQMALSDIAWFRSFTTVHNHAGNPACYVLQPADAYAAYALTQEMADYTGACYMRTHRPDVEFIYDSNTEFRFGKFEVLTEGRDLMIVTAGYMVHECNKVLDKLDRMGIDATLVDLYCLPFDGDALLDLANQNNGNILVVEDNYGASLGSAVADACTASGDGFNIMQMHVKRMPKSTRTEDEELKYCGLHHTDIVKAAASMLGVPVNA